MKETVTLGIREQQRLLVIDELAQGTMGLEEAAAVLGLSTRQVRRIVGSYQRDGVEALVHGNRSRTPINRIEDAIRAQVVTLATGRYAGINSTHLTELVAEREGIVLSTATVKRILAEAGIRSPKTRRQPRHRSRRPRSAKAGMLLQIDGSHHDWLEGRGPRLALIAGIDDATGTVPGAVFRQQEDAAGYLAMLQQVCCSVGLPLAVYHDQHGIFGVVDLKGTALYQMGRVRYEPTQVERVLAELGIGSIPAKSPQAKGRVERLFGTFQDRLVTELRLDGITTLADANAFLPPFLARFNAQFAVPAQEPDTAYRPWPVSLDPERIFCFRYRRRVGADNVVRFGEHRLQLLPTRERQHFARCEVDLYEQLDGRILVLYQDQVIASRDAPPEAPILRARGGPRPTTSTGPRREDRAAVTTSIDPTTPSRSVRTARKPAPDHPWRKR
jgi:transposase